MIKVGNIIIIKIPGPKQLQNYAISFMQHLCNSSMMFHKHDISQSYVIKNLLNNDNCILPLNQNIKKLICSGSVTMN